MTSSYRLENPELEVGLEHNEDCKTHGKAKARLSGFYSKGSLLNRKSAVRLRRDTQPSVRCKLHSIVQEAAPSFMLQVLSYGTVQADGTDGRSGGGN